MVQTSVTIAMQESLEEAELLHAKCYCTYQANKKKAADLYNSFGIKVCEQRAKQYNTSIAAQENIVRNNCKQSHAFQKINCILQQKQRHAITSVECTDNQ